MSRTTKKVLLVILLVLIATFIPLFLVKDADFAGSDDAGSQMINEVTGGYEPWFEAPIERIIGGEIPGETESLLFCLQTGIGVGILAFSFGYLVARKKYSSS